MRTPHFATLERLEDRIAPAGLVTVDFSNGVLTIDGSDGANHEVHLVKTGVNKFRVEGVATGINSLDNTSETFRGELKHVLIEGGAGNDQFEVTKLAPLKSFSFNGNAGTDSLTTSGFKIRADGSVNIAMGSETGTVDFGGGKTLIMGSLTMDLGGGATVGFGSAKTLIVGNAVFEGGVASDSVSFTGQKTTLKHSLTFHGAGGDDNFSSTGNTLKVKGNVVMTGDGETDHFVFDSQRMTFGKELAPRVIDINLGAGIGSVEFRGASTEVFGSVRIDLGTGGGTASLVSTETTIQKNVQVTGGAGNDNVEIDGRTKIKKGFSFIGDTGDDVFTVDGGLFAVKGSTSMNGGSGAEANVFDLNVVQLKLAGLSFSGGSSNDSVSIIADGVIGGNASFELGADGTGPSSVVLQSRAGIVNGLLFDGSLDINMTGATVDVLTIANIQVTDAFTAQTGENVSTVNISNLNGRGSFTLNTGAGADVVNLDNINAGVLAIDTGVGADELRIERNAAYAGISNVRGNAVILTGIGADQIRIGNSIDSANLLVAFGGGMTLDAGDGANMRNDIVASNTFVVTPTIVASGGTLTETPAV